MRASSLFRGTLVDGAAGYFTPFSGLKVQVAPVSFVGARVRGCNWFLVRTALKSVTCCWAVFHASRVRLESVQSFSQVATWVGVGAMSRPTCIMLTRTS